MRVEEVIDVHILKEGFGLMLSIKVLSRFQTLDPSVFHDLESLELDFIVAFTKTGIKHSVTQPKF